MSAERPGLGDDPDGDMDEIEAIAAARAAGHGYQPNAAESACCPFCLSMDPNKVGIEKATGVTCRNQFHCPVPESHSDQPGGVFRCCQYCDYREEPLIEPPADWAVGWVTPPGSSES